MSIIPGPGRSGVGPGIRLRSRVDPSLPWLTGGALAAVGLGAGLTRSPMAACLGILLVSGIAALAHFGPIVPATAAVAVLPWMVLFDELIPGQLRTFTAAGGVIALAVLAAPVHARRPAASFGAALLVAVLLIQGSFAESSEQYIQLAKYLLFPAAVLLVISPSGQELLRSQRKMLLLSGLAAMCVHLAIVGAGLGAIGTYYGVGERLGFAPAIPHELALLGIIVAAAGVCATERLWLQVGLFTLGAVPAALSGVRSALLAAVVILLVVLVRSRFHPRVLATIAGIIALSFVTGAASTVTARFDRQRQELSSVSALGSGRGEIWTAAISHWSSDGPAAVAVGSGLHSVNQFELEELGSEFVGHSDVVEILVDLGALGLLGYVLLWFSLLTNRLETVVILPILVYGLVNGSLDYIGPLTYGLCLSAALSPHAPPGGQPGAVVRAD